MYNVHAQKHQNLKIAKSQYLTCNAAANFSVNRPACLQITLKPRVVNIYTTTIFLKKFRFEPLSMMQMMTIGRKVDLDEKNNCAELTTHKKPPTRAEIFKYAP